MDRIARLGVSSLSVRVAVNDSFQVLTYAARIADFAQSFDLAKTPTD